MLQRTKKQRFDMILEPLQATLQLSLLSYMPVGTKLTIYNNILYHQAPKWHQPFMRLYNNDNKEDLYFLFHVLIRFTKFYDFMKNNKDTQLCKLYDLLVRLSKRGIQKLIMTYQDSNDFALINILQLYGAIMENPEQFQRVENSNTQKTILEKTESNPTCVDVKMKRRNKYCNNAVQEEIESEMRNTENDSSMKRNQTEQGRIIHSDILHDMKDIDKIFVTIQELYSIHEYHVMYNVLCMLETSAVNEIPMVIGGLCQIMEAKYIQIHKWISENIIY